MTDEHGIFMLDRVEPAIFPKPVNYGFIPATKDEDGDELDVLLVCHEPIPTGVLVKSKVIGIFNFEDDGEMDYKIVCVPADDRKIRRQHQRHLMIWESDGNKK